MPKATLEFNLPDEELEFRCAARGSEYRSLLWDIVSECRNRAKHGEPNTTWDEVYDMVLDLCRDANFDAFDETT